jgi:hypothetical protein
MATKNGTDQSLCHLSPYLFDDHPYYDCNTECSFEINEARPLRSEESAKIMLSRLQDKCEARPEVESQGLNPDLLAIKSADLEVEDHLVISI